MNYGWKGSTEQFLALSLQHFIDALAMFVYQHTKPIHELKLDKDIAPQISAWEDCYEKLQQLFKQHPALQGELIFEYAILRGSGRRPDVILILNGHVYVIECKSFNGATTAEYLQASLYTRDIAQYHSTVQYTNATVTGILLLTRHPNTYHLSKQEFQIYVATPFSLASLLQRLNAKKSPTAMTADDFLEGTYRPSPSILEAARCMLTNEPLPRIKAVASSNFDKVYATIHAIITEAQQTNTHHLIVVTGAPGAGKTLLGLQIAHDVNNAIYLSGNGPLVDVLQDTLQNTTFVQSLLAYKRDYLNYGKTPSENVIIFDEAQRAWDAAKMDKPFSEPDVIMQIATKHKPWSVVIGLIGEDQQIHVGEEGGLPLWNTAIEQLPITVHAKHSNTLFSNASRYVQHEYLHLNCSLRAHSALQYFEFVNALLNGNIQAALKFSEPLQQQRYPVLVTGDLKKARAHFQDLYKDDSKTVGIICASGADKLKKLPVVPFGQRYVIPKPHTEYFNHPSSTYYCKKLSYAATEFQTQGLELDCALVHWDEDLCWDGHKWNASYTKKAAKDPVQMKLNAYRVLLTRGRDATVIYVPPKEKLNKTWALLTETLQLPIL